MTPRLEALRARLPHYLEPALWSALALAGLALAWRAFRLHGWPTVAIGLGLATIAALGLAAWTRRARAAAAQAAGVVEIDEARIAYYAPSGGAFADLDAILQIDLATGGGQGPRWRLTLYDAPALVIPAGASGAERLFDVFAGLPGARLGLAADALSRTDAGVFLIWKRADP